MPSSLQLVERSWLVNLNQQTGTVRVHSAAEQAHIPVKVIAVFNLSVDDFLEELMPAHLQNVPGIGTFIIEISMNPVQQNFEFAEILADFFFVTAGLENGNVRKVFLQVCKNQFLLFRTYGQADAVCMMLCEAVFCSFKIMTYVRRLKPKQFPVTDTGECVQNFLLIRHEQKLVHPTTSKAFWDYVTL